MKSEYENKSAEDGSGEPQMARIYVSRETRDHLKIAAAHDRETIAVLLTRLTDEYLEKRGYLNR